MVLLVPSPQSINSEWVKTEVAKARKREVKEGRRMLFPIRLEFSFTELQDWECFDADTVKDSAREIREYFIPDFSHWKDHDFRCNQANSYFILTVSERLCLRNSNWLGH